MSSSNLPQIRMTADAVQYLKELTGRRTAEHVQRVVDTAVWLAYHKERRKELRKKKKKPPQPPSVGPGNTIRSGVGFTVNGPSTTVSNASDFTINGPSASVSDCNNFKIVGPMASVRSSRNGTITGPFASIDEKTCVRVKQTISG